MEKVFAPLALMSAGIAVFSVACGINGNENNAEISLESSKSKGDGGQGGKASGSKNDEVTLGLKQSVWIENAGDWNMAKEDGSPHFYRPVNFDRAMSAFGKAMFYRSGQQCSGIRTAVPNSDGTFNIYFMTAAHCLYNVNPVGVASGSIARNHSFTLTVYSASQSGRESPDFRFAGVGAERSPTWFSRVYGAPSIQSFSDLRPEQAGNSDIVRFLLERSVSAQTASQNSMPLCSKSIERPADLNISRRVMPIRMALGMGGSWVDLLRMNGKVQIGNWRSFDQYGAEPKVVNFVQRTQNFESGVGLYAYTTQGGKGVEATDSGGAILYGIQESPAETVNKTFPGVNPALTSKGLANWKQSADLNPDLWRVRELTCVSGVIAREFSRNSFHVNFPAEGRVRKTMMIGKSVVHGDSNLLPMVLRDITELGDTTTSIIQEVTSDVVWHAR